jgi:mycothiol synthase
MSINIRNYRPEDLEAYVDLFIGAPTPDKSGKAASTRWIKEQLGKPDREPERDLFLAEEEGALVGYVNILGSVESGRFILEGHVHPSDRRRGIGTMLLKKAIAHSRELGATVIQIPLLDEMTSGRLLAEREGFSVVRVYWHMEIEGEVAEAPFPPRFGCRHFMPGDEETLANIHNRVFGASWGFRPYSAADVRYRVQMSCRRPEGIFLATHGDAVVGYCWTRIEEGYGSREAVSGTVWLLGVDSPYRRRGLGRALLTTAVNYLMGLGITTVGLTIDSRNLPAMAMYEGLGFRRREAVLWCEKRLAPRPGIWPFGP